jgi:hypothetical protein
MVTTTIEDADPIRSWADVAGRLEHQLKNNDWWLFRGVTDARNHTPIPSIGRPNARLSGFSYSFDDEKSLLSAFKAEARPYLSYSPDSDLEWLTIAQHHGVPTRLLDWTESFLVALFFAVRNGGLYPVVDLGTGRRHMEPVDAPIYYTVNPPRCSDDDKHSPFSITPVKAFVPPHISPHIPAQRSVFTIHSDPTQVPDLPRIRRSIVTHTACMKIKMILDNQAVNEGSLFPTITGLCQQLSWRYKWNRLNAYRP